MQEYVEMSPLRSPRRLYLKQVPKKGNGVFCADPIAEGETIELCHTLKAPQQERELIDKTMLSMYAYVRNDHGLSIVLGFGSFYNHSYSPNSNFIWNKEETMVGIVALEDIPANTEIIFNFHGIPDSHDPKAGISSGMMTPPPNTMISSAFLSLSKPMTLPNIVICEPERILKPIPSTSSWIAAPTICSGVWNLPV